MTLKHTPVYGWVAALLMCALFVALGQWQLRRMHEKQQVLDQAAHVRAHPRTLVQALAESPRLAWVTGAGRFLPQQVLLDNQSRHGRAGVRVYQLFAPAGTAHVVLVEIGWLALPADRHMPMIVPLQGTAVLSGLLAPPPSSGLALGPALAAGPQPQRWLATRLDPEALRLALGRSDIASQVLRLDPALPLGYARDLDLLPNTLPPVRHLGYAVQWFVLALAVLVTAVILSWRGWRRSRRAH